MKIRFPDYENCITGVANSILRKFGIEAPQGLGLLDRWLQGDYQNIVVILLDGMGKCIMDKNLERNGFFHLNLKGTYSSVFPPTTVAATTSIASGQTPQEHCWLGWDCYYPQIDKNVTVFRNQETGTEKQAADYNVAQRYCGYESVVSRVRQNGGNAFEVTPFIEPFFDSFGKICERIKNLCRQSGKKYVYSYWNEPDFTMHRKGCYGVEVRKILQELEAQVKELCEELKDSLVIVTADHGLVETKGVILTDYPKVTGCLTRAPSIEPRALNLFVKEEKREQFQQEFQREFGDKFLLWTKQQVIDRKLFGGGKEHSNFQGMLGDFLAVAISDVAIYSSKEKVNTHLAAHAGLTEDEMMIPLIVIER